LQVSSQVHKGKRKKKKNHFKADISCISLADNRLMGVVLGGRMVKNLDQLGCKFDLDQNKRKSLQVNAKSQCQTESQVEAS